MTWSGITLRLLSVAAVYFFFLGASLCFVFTSKVILSARADNATASIKPVCLCGPSLRPGQLLPPRHSAKTHCGLITKKEDACHPFPLNAHSPLEKDADFSTQLIRSDAAFFLAENT